MSLSDAEKISALQQAEQRFREDPLQHLRKQLQVPFEPKWTVRHKREKGITNFTQAVERLTGQGISMELDYITHPVLSKMRETDSQIRDTYIVNQIAQAVRGNDRVLAMMGGFHPATHQTALHNYLPRCNLRGYRGCRDDLFELFSQKRRSLRHESFVASGA